MKIGLTGSGVSVDKIIAQAQRAEADGFSTLWYASVVAGDPLAAMAITGRATSRIELGTAVLQTYPCHPVLQANRVAAVADAFGRPGFTLGIGPSHRSSVTGVYGLSYDHPGRNTEEYLQILTTLLRGENIDYTGMDWSAHTPGRPLGPSAHPTPVLLSALSPRLLRVAGETADGTILWMATARAIDQHIAPRITAAAASAGRPKPRIVAGLPVAVHGDVTQARQAVATTAVVYGTMPNYQRILEIGGVSTAADGAIVGDERAVAAQLQSLLDAGATDLWLNIVPVGDNPSESIRRTRTLLRDLAT